jgi:Tfp pilus tip-associated adhesin PilY1
VDGPITLWLDETATGAIPNNGVLDVGAGEKAYLFFGLRRGGQAYYALDVTNPDSPVLKWKITSSTSGFAHLGNTWSKPVVAQLKWSTSPDPAKTHPIVVFGGGYNDSAANTETSGGNAVYMVNALTGTAIWKTEAMSNGVPSRIRVMDMDRNGSVDRLYFGDTGGKLWRVDLNHANFDTNPSNDNNLSEAKVYNIANLGGTGTDARMFFEEPSVAVFNGSGGLVATIAIGSGDRTNPIANTVHNKFFVLYDKNIFNLTVAPTVVTVSDLDGTFPVTATRLADPTFKGWEKGFTSTTSTTGEKVLSTATTYQGKVLFTTFGTRAPDDTVPPDACNPSE